MKEKIKSLVLFSSLFISGCLSKTFHESNFQIDKTKQMIEQTKSIFDKPEPPVIHKLDYYVDSEPIALNTEPQWLKQRVSLQANNMPLQLLIKHLLRDTQVNVSYDKSIQMHRLVNLNYSGTLKGALKVLSNITNYFYTTADNYLHWSAFQTKTFNVSFMPGSSNYLVGQQNSTSDNLLSGSLNQINDQQFSNMSGQLSLWQDLKNTLNELKSPNGRVIISESTTSVTAQDHPSNVRAIGNYIAQLNKQLSRQVAIKVQVLEIELDKEFNYGINWNLVIHALGTRFNLIGDLGQATNLTQNMLVLTGGTSASAGIKIGNPNGAQTLINALNQQGKVRVVTEPELVTMNNQIASIRITQNVGYVQSVSQSLSQNFITTSITPGSITDGFTLYILPKIQKNKIYMQISSTIANLERLDKVSTSEENDKEKQQNQQSQAIQVPTLAQKSFNQRSVINSGSTLIIAGYKRLRDAVNKASYFGIAPLGGEGAQSNNIETLVLITPTILNSGLSNVNTNTP